MNNQKLLTKPEDFMSEDVDGYQGILFTDASPEEIRQSARAWFGFHAGNLNGKFHLFEYQEIGNGTTLCVFANKPKFEELADLISRGFVTRVDCLGAGEKLHHIDDLVKNLLSQGKKVALFPFTKNKPELLGPQTPMGC